jgi:hypothetical protein
MKLNTFMPAVELDKFSALAAGVKTVGIFDLGTCCSTAISLRRLRTCKFVHHDNRLSQKLLSTGFQQLSISYNRLSTVSFQAIDEIVSWFTKTLT